MTPLDLAAPRARHHPGVHAAQIVADRHIRQAAVHVLTLLLFVVGAAAWAAGREVDVRDETELAPKGHAACALRQSWSEGEAERVPVHARCCTWIRKTSAKAMVHAQQVVVGV